MEGDPGVLGHPQGQPTPAPVPVVAPPGAGHNHSCDRGFLHVALVEEIISRICCGPTASSPTPWRRFHPCSFTRRLEGSDLTPNQSPGSFGTALEAWQDPPAAVFLSMGCVRVTKGHHTTQRADKLQGSFTATSPGFGAASYKASPSASIS